MFVSADRDPRRAGTIWTLDLGQPAGNRIAAAGAEFRIVNDELAGKLAEAVASSQLPPDTSGLNHSEFLNQIEADVLRRFDGGRRCYTAWVDGQLVSYAWVSFEEEFVGELRLLLRLPPGEAYIWDCATRPEYRQRGLYTALLAFVCSELRQEQVRRAWIGTDLENLVSQRGIARAGFQHVADLVIKRVLAMRLAWVEGLPGVPECLVAQARHVFLGGRDQVWLEAVKQPQIKNDQSAVDKK